MHFTLLFEVDTLDVNLLFPDHPEPDLGFEKMSAIMWGQGDVKMLIKYRIDVAR